MKYVEAKGARIPALGLGTFGLDGAACERVVARALEIGYRHVDTAVRYANEAEVGRGIRASGVPRGEIFLTTKIWQTDLAYADARASIEASLGRLGTDYVDLLLIHWPNDAIPLEEPLRALAEAKADGKARHIGVSNFTTRHLDEAVERHGARELVCNQVEYHVYLNQDRVLERCRRYGMWLTAYTPIAKARVNEDATVRRIAEAHGRTPVQIALRWLMEQEGVAAIPRTTNEERLAQNLAIFDFALNADERRALDALRGNGRIVDPDFGPDWDPV